MAKVISIKKVEDICAKVEKEPTQKSIAQFIKIFRICVSQNEDENADKAEEEKHEQDFIIDDAGVYDKVVTFALQRFPILLKKVLRLDAAAILEKVNSRKLEIVLKVYLLNIVKMAENVHDENMLIYILRFYPMITDFMFPLKTLFMRFLKYMIELWSTSNNLQLKLQCFIVIRRICKNTPTDQVDKLFRRVYVAYFENVRHTTWRSYESIIFMINCFSELMTENKEAAYYIGFSYLRQIAVLLKANMAKKGEEKKVFNWQMVNSIRLWTGVISKQPGVDDLGQLIYPLVQLITGVNQFSNATEYLPLKFHLIECLNTIASKTNTFVPTLKFIKDILNSGEFRKKKIQSTKKPYDFAISVKIDNKYRNTTVLWNDIFKTSLDLSTEYLAVFSRDIGFPELSYNYIRYLKKLQDSVKFIIYKMQIKELLKAIVANNALIYEKRKTINFAPRNLDASNKFSDEQFSDIKDTPLELVRNKIVKDRGQHIKQRILAEKDQIYDEGEEDEDNSGDDNQDDEDESNEQEKKGKKNKKQKDMDLADASDSDAFDPENYESSEEEDDEEQAPQKKKGKSKRNKDEADEDSYDLENMDYEGDPDELPDFDLIDENDKYNYKDENQLSDDDFDESEGNMDEEDDE